MKLAVVTIGQSPRVDLTPEIRDVLPPGTEIVEHGALDGLDRAAIAALAPQPGERVLTSRLRDGTSAVVRHDDTVALVGRAVARGEADGADATFLVCTGEFRQVAHTRPLFTAERLAHDGVRGLLSGFPTRRLGILSPLPEQVTEAYAHWEASMGVRPTAVGAASPYTDDPVTVAAAGAMVGGACDLLVMDCIGYTAAMRDAVQEACGDTRVVTARDVAARLLGSLL
ncbi:AroM family protein [Georgenia faecalis]|uniref:AroM family protein n=1 Tax=Georgenia faecalis TaxID=2483799 RepID=A0ABV9D987_9MICO|nr:AroM family protein [Georgenia faecalis]